jgi:opacity protein-like surface antigen
LRFNSVLARARVLLFLLALLPSTASADWLYIPFFGATFAGSTASVDLEHGASSTQFIFGGSVGWWSQGIIGFEGDFGYAPRFFERNNRGGLVTNSNAVTLEGNVIIAAPLSFTRESLRPYLVAGLGWMHFSIEEGTEFFPEFFGSAQNSVGMNIGGGVIGFITPRTGIRFEVRQFRSLDRDRNPLTAEPDSQLSFWRATVGVVIRR